MDSSILVVDDESALRSTLKLVLQTKGYKVTTAGSAAEAEGLFLQQSFDVVITDMRMETDTSGYEVAALAKSYRPPPAVIILTAYPLLAQDWRTKGADAVVSKPSSSATLLELVNKFLEQRQAARMNTQESPRSF